MADYRIDFTITRRMPGDGDFTEIGFGSTAAWTSLNQAASDVDAIVQNREWETSPGMPDPADVQPF